MRTRRYLLTCFLCAITLVGCDQANGKQAQSAPKAALSPQARPVLDAEEISPDSAPVTRFEEGDDTDIREIAWDALITEDWRPEVLMEQYNVDDLSEMTCARRNFSTS